ncbi:Maf-like protein [Aliirhizobium smilacinae]|uniref:7-methyl-GTP pyrophosphatase n=1 Tax=Aliirhizobium smilacinae TaxID=1395944 RepID=A0A5C4XBF1_9HYPH|nr:Maf-like protein [Rhizobium smilacinae]TNM60652.1 Maf-like protein [Rhizobium smilacinae]
MIPEVTIVLASSSPFRRMLLQNAGLSFESRAADIDERQIEASADHGGPEIVAGVLAKAKAQDVSRHFADALVIGSDQTMSLADRVYHKATNRAEARETLMSLSGRTHRLNSAVAIVLNGNVVWEHISYAELTARNLSEEFVDRYLDRIGDKAFSSVGGYQLEGEGIHLFSAIDGDYFTILGLPMLPLLEELRRLGAIDG